MIGMFICDNECFGVVWRTLGIFSFPPYSHPFTMDGCSFNITIGGDECKAYLIQRGGNGAVFCLENNEGQRRALKLHNAVRFSCMIVDENMRSRHRNAIRDIFHWAESVWFK